ncbi:MAG: DUF167 family protein [Perlucidibaca sp.]
MNAAAGVAVRRDGDDLLLIVHAQPGASRSGFAGLHGEALKIRIQAPAVDGRANEAMRRFLAEGFAVPAARFSLVSGASARHKRWRIGQPARIPDELAALLPAAP